MDQGEEIKIYTYISYTQQEYCMCCSNKTNTMKKCIVLDLDNTLWGGVIGEDGMEGISLSVSSPGSHFVAFQQALLDLYERGIILAINSQNNPEDALEVIRTHPNMILKEQHFAATRINWNDKVQNLKELAAELNIGLDAMVFLDDSPTNRSAVREFLPQVETPELPADPQLYTKFLHSLPYFESSTTTDEDKMRGNLYVTERLRRESEKEFANREDFLRSLDIELQVFEDNDVALPRLAQLTEKTNQFNTNKQPMSMEEIAGYITSPKYAVFYASARDRFGDHGIIAFALVRKEGKEWNLESLLMSCRVFGRGIEDAFVHKIAERAGGVGVETMRVAFTPTEKNKPAKDFLDRRTSQGKLSTKTAFAPDWIKII